MSLNYPEVLEVVQRFLGERADATFAPSTVILETDLESLDVAGALVDIEDHFNVQVNEDQVEWSQVRTVDDLTSVFVHHADAVA